MLYHEFYSLKKAPFSLTPDTDFFCDLPSYTEAIDLVLYCLSEGDGFIKLIGEVGVGKTLLCKKLLAMLPSNYRKCYLPNPDLTPEHFKEALAIELGLDVIHNSNQHALLMEINNILQQFFDDNVKVVLIVDEAQAMKDETLETLRLLTNMESIGKKLIQVVLVGQPELDDRLNQVHLRQLRQRITFSHYIKPLSLDETSAYISRRLVAAGHQHGAIFQSCAKKMLMSYAKGIPRVLNILCHKSLLMAYSRSSFIVSNKDVKAAINDSRDILGTVRRSRSNMLQKIIVAAEIALVPILLILLSYIFYLSFY